MEHTEGRILGLKEFLNLADGRNEDHRVPSWRHGVLRSQSLVIEPLHDQITRLILGRDHSIDGMLVQMSTVQFVTWRSNL